MTVQTLFVKPQPGQKISVTTKFTNPILASKEQYRYTTYIGTVEKDFKWLSNQEFVLSTPEDVDMPVRVLHLNYVSDLKMSNGEAFQTREVATRQVRLVKGTKGDVYTVATENGKTTCSCSGFQFRGMCRHVKDAA